MPVLCVQLPRPGWGIMGLMTSWSRGPFWAVTGTTIAVVVGVTIYAWIVGLDEANLVLPIILTVLTAGILGGTILLVIKREAKGGEALAAPTQRVSQRADNNSRNYNAGGNISVNEDSDRRGSS